MASMQHAAQHSEKAQSSRVGRLHKVDRKQDKCTKFKLQQWLMLNIINVQVCALSVKQARATAK